MAIVENLFGEGESEPDAVSAPNDIGEFKALVADCRRKKYKTIISNSRPKQFTVIMAQLIESARSKVTIYAGHLSRFDASGEPLWADADIILSAQSFLEKSNTALRFLIRYQLDADPGVGLGGHPLLSDTVNMPNRAGLVSLAVACESEKSQGGVKGYRLHPQNFAVVDECAYRLEFEQPNAPAIATFNGPSGARTLLGAFEKMVLQLRAVARETPETKPHPRAFNFAPHERIDKYDDLISEGRMHRYLREKSSATKQPQNYTTSNPLALSQFGG